MPEPTAALKFAVLTLVCGLGVSCLAQQVSCAADVTQGQCKQFDNFFGTHSLWATNNHTKNLAIIVVTPQGFKAERERYDTLKKNRAKFVKTVGDINKIARMETGSIIFDNAILECETSTFVTKVIVSTDEMKDGLLDPISADQLFFYVVGFDEGMLAGAAPTVTSDLNQSRPFDSFFLFTPGIPSASRPSAAHTRS